MTDPICPVCGQPAEVTRSPEGTWRVSHCGYTCIGTWREDDREKAVLIYEHSAPAYAEGIKHKHEHKHKQRKG